MVRTKRSAPSARQQLLQSRVLIKRAAQQKIRWTEDANRSVDGKSSYDRLIQILLRNEGALLKVWMDPKADKLSLSLKTTLILEEFYMYGATHRQSRYEITAKIKSIIKQYEKAKKKIKLGGLQPDILFRAGKPHLSKDFITFKTKLIKTCPYFFEIADTLNDLPYLKLILEEEKRLQEDAKRVRIPCVEPAEDSDGDFSVHSNIEEAMEKDSVESNSSPIAIETPKELVHQEAIHEGNQDHSSASQELSLVTINTKGQDKIEETPMIQTQHTHTTTTNTPEEQRRGEGEQIPKVQTTKEQSPEVQILNVNTSNLHETVENTQTPGLESSSLPTSSTDTSSIEALSNLQNSNVEELSKEISMNSSSTVDKQHEKPIFSCIFNHNIVLDSEKIVSQPRADMQEVCVLSSEQQTDKQRSIDCEATLSPFSIANSLFPKPTAELNKNLKNVEDLIQKTNKRKKYELDCFTENALLSKDIGDKENRSLKESKSSVKRRKQQAEMKRYDCKTKMYEAKTRRYEVKIRRYEAETRRYEMETKKYEFKTLKMLAKLHKKYKELNISAESSSSSISLPSFENPENSLLNPETHHFTTF